MTRLLDEAIAKVRGLSASTQDEAAEVLLAIAARGEGPVLLDAETRAAVREGLAQADRGEFATDKELAALFNRP
jgi:predicted transcriptional regulator